MKKYRLIITADTNDADYIKEDSEITLENLELIKPIIQAIKDFKPYIGSRIDWKHPFSHNFPFNECHREDLGEKTIDELYGHLKNFGLFCEYLPYNEHGFHTIKSIRLLEITNETELFKSNESK